ncbi:MAG TPA: hypothetical protein VMU99_06525 [Acidimicrobiales bacterium]|nr:hypothetical protein [Acidimicrobiales bacterium]
MLRARLAVVHGSILAWLETRRTDERGASIIEYALLLAMIVTVAVGAVLLVGHATMHLLNNSAQNIAGHG